MKVEEKWSPCYTLHCQFQTSPTNCLLQADLNVSVSCAPLEILPQFTAVLDRLVFYGVKGMEINPCLPYART